MRIIKWSQDVPVPNLSTPSAWRQTIYQGAPETVYGHPHTNFTSFIGNSHPFRRFLVSNLYSRFFNSFVPGNMYENEKTHGAFDSSSSKVWAGVQGKPRSQPYAIPSSRSALLLSCLYLDINTFQKYNLIQYHPALHLGILATFSNMKKKAPIFRK